MTQLEAERLSATVSPRGDDAAAVDAEDSAVVTPEQVSASPSQAAPPC